MSLSINTNLAAMQATRYLGNANSALGASISRLSSGLKINSAADDPAGLVISQKLSAQVGGIGAAITNAGNAVNMVQTAEGALGEVSNLLVSMRNLALNAANAGASDSATVAADQAQISNALKSINKIAAETQFGNKNLLDGSAGIKASVVSNTVVAANLNSATMTSSTANVFICVTQAATQGSMASSTTYAANTTALSSTGYLMINNVRIDYSTSMTVDTLTSAINNVSDQTGVTASDSSGTITLKSTGYGAVGGRIQVTDTQNVLVSGATSATASGANAQAKVTTDSGLASNLTDSSWTSGDGLTLKDSLGDQIVLSQTAGTTTGALNKSGGTPGAVIAATNGTLVFQVGAYAGQTREVNIGSATTDNLGAGVVTGQTLSNIDVTSASGAQDALKILDQAISDISSTRANLGATQTNVLQTTINSLNVAKQNLSASASSLTDTDMATEMTNYTKQQILEQAGVSMLAQANQSPQMLLKLLG